MAGTRHKLTPFERAYRAGADGLTYLAPGDGEEFFSWSPCDLCNTTLGGNRHDATGVSVAYEEVLELHVCTDCLIYMANGELPEDWQEGADD